MQLKVRDGKLRLGSVYKLFIVAWTTTWIAFFGFVLFLTVIVTLITGEMSINGEMVTGRGPALLAILPVAALFPVIVFLQSFIFGAFLTAGIWLYRLKRPIEVIIEGGVP